VILFNVVIEVMNYISLLIFKVNDTFQ